MLPDDGRPRPLLSPTKLQELRVPQPVDIRAPSGSLELRLSGACVKRLPEGCSLVARDPRRGSMFA